MNGFFDLQVNGYAGIDFNSDQLTQNQMVTACERLEADGVESILATIITAPLPQMLHRIRRIASWIRTVDEIHNVVAGIHIEGPFLSPLDGYAGAHPKDAIVPANQNDMNRILEAGDGCIRMVTLAPECDSDARTTAALVSKGVLVAAGHTNASLEDLDRAIDAGMSLFTHLGNACPNLLPRHDNIVNRVLSRADRLAVSLIADGHHLPPFVLQNYLRCIPDQNIVIVSDAISAAGLGPGEYQLGGQTVYVDEKGAAWAECRTHFAGCATPLRGMQAMLRSALEIPVEESNKWMSDNPRRLFSR